jgi:hypothetical protein
MQRHNLSIRIPQATSLVRAVGFNKPKIDEFFTVLAEIMSENQFQAQNIWNMDETGVATVHKPNKIVTTKGIVELF